MCAEIERYVAVGVSAPSGGARLGAGDLRYEDALSTKGAAERIDDAGMGWKTVLVGRSFRRIGACIGAHHEQIWRGSGAVGAL